MEQPKHILEEGTYTDNDYRELLDRIGEFRKTKPYEKLLNEHCFGIRQADGSVTWCIVMGNGGMEFGITLFYGDLSLGAFYDLLDNPNSPDVAPFRTLNGVYFNLVNKKDLEKEDLDLFNNYQFSGYGRGNGWPLIRRYLPGHVMSPFVTARDVEALNSILTHIDDIAGDIDSGVVLFENEEGKELWPVVAIDEKGSRAWGHENPDFNELIQAPEAFDPFMTNRLKKLPQEHIEGIFVGSPMIFAPIAETVPPYLPEACVVVNMDNGMILNFGMCDPDEGDYNEQRKHIVLESLLKVECRPEQLFFDSPALSSVFETVFEGTNTEVAAIEPPMAYYQMLDEMSCML